MKTKRAGTGRKTDARQRILEAAEGLFAEHGFDSISIRDITSACDANVAAINYHFGGREKLVAEVMLRYIRPINEERLARLEVAQGRRPGKPVPLEELIDAFSRPLVSQVKKSPLSERLFHKLCARVFSEHIDALPDNVEAHFMPVIDRFSRAFEASLPDVPPDELIWRMHFMVGGMLHMLSHQDMLQRMSHGRAGNPTIETTLGRFIRFAAAGLREGSTNETTDSTADSPQGFFQF